MGKRVCQTINLKKHEAFGISPNGVRVQAAFLHAFSWVDTSTWNWGRSGDILGLSTPGSSILQPSDDFCDCSLRHILRYAPGTSTLQLLKSLGDFVKCFSCSYGPQCSSFKFSSPDREGGGGCADQHLAESTYLLSPSSQYLLPRRQF